MDNSKNPVIGVYFSNLKPFSVSFKYRRECPFCNHGHFAVTRDSETYKIVDTDRCLGCGQKVHYLDFEEIENYLQSEFEKAGRPKDA